MPSGGHPKRQSIDDFAGVLDGARANRPEAWEALYRWLAGGVAGYLRMLGARDVEDLTSEVFLAVFRRVGAFHGTEANFRSWVFTVAHSRLLDERRRHARTPHVAPLDASISQAESAQGPEELALNTLANERVEAICARLAPDQRAVVLLRVIGGLSLDEVATAIGKSTGAVKQLQRRGFEGVRKLLLSEGVTL
jgi:RNA polymerase sigma-70 factor (ECF subfamily)